MTTLRMRPHVFQTLAVCLLALSFFVSFSASSYPVRTDYKPSKSARFSVRNISSKPVKCVISAGVTSYHAQIVPGASVGTFTAADGFRRDHVSVRCQEVEKFLNASKVWSLTRYSVKPAKRDLIYRR